MSSEIQFSIVDKSSVDPGLSRNYYTPMIDALINLPRSKALAIPILPDRKPETFRMCIVRAADRHGLKVLTYFGRDHKILYIWRGGTNENQGAESESDKLD